MRSVSSGTIPPGSVSIPGKMCTATESNELELPFLHKEDMTPSGYEPVQRAA